MLMLLLAACHPLNGEWEGEIDCGDYGLNTEVTLEWTGSRYEGSGTIDCTDAWNMPCEQLFDLQVDAERRSHGDRDLDVDVDDCSATLDGDYQELACDNPSDVEWDGADRIDGEWGGCDVDLFRR